MNARLALCCCAAIAVFAGCGVPVQRGLTPPTAIGTAGRSPAARGLAAGYRLLFDFDGSDGNRPEGRLKLLRGTLYGTTYWGGTHCRLGCGTVFSVTSSGQEQVVHQFDGVPDGAHPSAGLALLNGSFYGTTVRGGAARSGTIFSITAAGKERVVYDFKRYGHGDASQPNGLTAYNGVLYGTSSDGGTFNEGTVFSVTAAGKERVLHSFTGHLDGARPVAALTVLNGTLYGTAEEGGVSEHGTVFSITPGGTLRVIYRFKGIPDGNYPQATLTPLNGSLYGTTSLGGTYDYGTVFRITTAGKESVLYSFKGKKGGAGPTGLTYVNGVFYGTTEQGFRHDIPCQGYGCGTIFSITTAGKERLLYTFRGGSDGEFPSPLTAFNGTLYGTTQFGGTNGEGTVFSLRP